MNRIIRVVLGACLTLLFLDFPTTGICAQTARVIAPPHLNYRPNRILVKPKPGVSLATLHQQLNTSAATEFSGIGNLQIVPVPAGTTADALIAAYQQSGLVEYAEHDYIVHVLATPNDFQFANGDLWNLENDGQYGGVVGADIHATAAWDTRTSASNVIVAVIDTGARLTHEDLAGNLWVNPGENAANNLDDDNDGYTNDVHGINVLDGSGNPNDDHGHGSHVSGIIGAVGNNSVGIAGICWKVQLMECKFIDGAGDGAIADAVKCIDYARTKGAKVINASWGDTNFTSQALFDAINSARLAGIIFVAAAGNSAMDNDVTPLYPANYNLDNIIRVAATTRTDSLADFSDYGKTTVDIAAPGNPIFSCWNTADNAYQNYDGTSMAAAHLTGAAALVRAMYPNDDYHLIIQRIMAGVDKLPGLADKCVSGGRLNLQKALTQPNLTILGLARGANNSSTITWLSQIGKTYQVDSKTNLNSTWQAVSGVISATNSVTSFTDPGASSQRFYVVQQLN